MDRSILPVIVGGDTSTYALGRAMNEAFDCEVICVSPAPITAITRSRFFRIWQVPMDQGDEELLGTLEEISAANPGAHLVLLANTDWFSRFTGEYRDRLSPHFIIPFPELPVWEKVTDKAHFSELCQRAGVLTPRDAVVDLHGAGAPAWRAPEIDLTFPVVAKPADGLEYDAVDFPEKRKVYFAKDPGELARIWGPLADSGFRGRFLVQEMIPGDDTCGISLTFYADSHGDVTLSGGARVLVEDHFPRLIGNPIAMMTQDYPELVEAGERLLKEVGYTGFANMDVKIDPRDGRAYFLEINPRIGRNCYYMVVAGANPMVPMAADLIDGERPARVEGKRTAIYSLIPNWIIGRYLRQPRLGAQVKSLLRKGAVQDPMINPAERDLRRAIIVRLQKLNYVRKLRRYYPRPVGQYI